MTFFKICDIGDGFGPLHDANIRNGQQTVKNTKWIFRQPG